MQKRQPRLVTLPPARKGVDVPAVIAPTLIPQQSLSQEALDRLGHVVEIGHPRAVPRASHKDSDHWLTRFGHWLMPPLHFVEMAFSTLPLAVAAFSFAIRLGLATHASLPSPFTP